MSQTITVQRVEPFFEHWLDFESVAGRSGERGDADGGVTLMPSMYRHPAVREFYRCIELYREYAPRWYWHLAAFYKCEWRQMQRVTGRRRDKSVPSGWALVYGPWEKERVLPRGVDVKRVGTGVRFVTQIWNPEIDPSLPNHPLLPKQVPGRRVA